jgi:hypothetical protein
MSKASVLLVMGAGLLASQLARAETPQDSHWVQLEYFRPNVNSSARLDASATVRGTTLDMERDLGLAHSQGTPYFLLGTRLGQPWRLEFEYYQLRRSGARSLNRDVQWGDATFPLATTIDAHFNTTIYRLTGGWSFIRTNQAELGAALGLHVTDFDLGLAGQVAGAATAASFQQVRRDQLVPLPTIGAYGSYQVAPQWTVQGRVDYLSLNYQNYDGKLVNSLAAVDWRFSRNFSVGAGYRYVKYTLGLSKPDFDGEADYRFKGPIVYIAAGF